MEIKKNTLSRTINGIEYTIVLDKQELTSDMLKQGAKSEDRIRSDIDRLYKNYETMRLTDPNTDPDTIYPRSYQWRLGDRYDLGKVAAIEEALKKWVRIDETEAYEKYIENTAKKSYAQVKWDD